MKTRRWKVKKLEDGRWLAHHPNCPPRDHFCWRWISFDASACGTRKTLPAAYQHAVNGYHRDERERYLRETPGGDTHIHMWTRLFDHGRSYVGCAICRQPGPR